MDIRVLKLDILIVVRLEVIAQINNPAAIKTCYGTIFDFSYA